MVVETPNCIGGGWDEWIFCQAATAGLLAQMLYVGYYKLNLQNGSLCMLMHF